MPGEKDNMLVPESGRKAGQTLDDEEAERLLRKVRPFVNSVIRIQSMWRGHLVRVRTAKMLEMPGGSHMINEIEELDTMPEIQNPVTKQLEEKLGPFSFSQAPNGLTPNRKARNPVAFDNNTIYIGEWANGLREGRGKQVWQDGSVYEGWWKNGMANGGGRLIHADGDVYEGQWENDKARLLASQAGLAFDVKFSLVCIACNFV